MPRWMKFVILTFFPLILAMQSSDNGTIEGYVSDEVGPVTKAAVEARNIVSGVVLRMETDASGYYLFESLGAGRYSLWVRAENRSSYWIPRVTVSHGQVVRQDVRLTRTSQPTTMLR